MPLNHNTLSIRCLAFNSDMAAFGDNKLRAVVDIAAAGDVVLVVGPENIRMRIHSLTLKATSNAFSVILGVNWKGGRDLLEDGSVELLLPKENAKAMEYICAIIHHQNICCLLR